MTDRSEAERRGDDHRIFVTPDVTDDFEDVWAAIEDYLKRAGEIPNDMTLTSLDLRIDVDEPLEVVDFEAEADVEASIAGVDL